MLGVGARLQLLAARQPQVPLMLPRNPHHGDTRSLRKMMQPQQFKFQLEKASV
jgi:hypothetical protein